MLDYLIIGQGIAGSMLGWFLQKRGKKILIVDQFNPNSSSRIAAGIFNPITGRRFVKTWMADELFPFAENTYREIEQITDCKFYHRKSIRRRISGNAELKEVELKKSRKDYLNYLRCDSTDRDITEIEILQGGNVDLRSLITAMKAHFTASQSYLESEVKHEDIHIQKGHARWKSYKARRIIFCEGYRALYNPWFKQLPFTHAKGEILTINAPDLKLDDIQSRGVFILPLGENNYKVGSTYDWSDLNEVPTNKGKEELIRKIDGLINCTYSILDHKAGIRPTVKDRRSLIGIHPDCPELGIFNGLGTKGVSLSPYFASHFVDHLEDGKPLNKEADIRRFLKNLNGG